MSLRSLLKRIALRLPGFRGVVIERDALRQKLLNPEVVQPAHPFVPPGHFYSPIPSLDEVRHNEDRIFRERTGAVPGIDLREGQQLELLNGFVGYYSELPFRETKTEGMRYYFENPAFSYGDAIHLYCMIRHIAPKKIIEIGSGFSSCVTLDTNERFFDGSIETTFIEPYPDLLLSLIKPEDKSAIKILPIALQDVDKQEFSRLQSGDILFVDSTHVSKVNSDVNHIFFEILPALASGVYVHFHDIFSSFEYPKEWVYEGRAWNELYLLRAFLQYNSQFEVVLFGNYMGKRHKSFYKEHMPLVLESIGGSIWLRKI